MRAPKLPLVRSRVVYDQAARRSAAALFRGYGAARRVLRLVPAEIREEGVAIFAFLRVCDETVDVHRGPHARALLAQLEQQVEDARWMGYSTNPIVHVFASTSIRAGIDNTAIAELFDALRMDLDLHVFTPAQYDEYVRGTAEFTMVLSASSALNVERKPNEAPKALTRAQEDACRTCARALQRVIFLRDFSVDYLELGRLYFPELAQSGPTRDGLDAVIAKASAELRAAGRMVESLPPSMRRSTRVLVDMYSTMLRKIARQDLQTTLAVSPALTSAEAMPVLLRGYLPQWYQARRLST